MSTPAPEINFSELSNHPVDAVRKLQESPTRSLRIHRRGDDEDLVLVTATRAKQVIEAASATTRLFLALMEHDAGVRDLVTEVIPTAFPWVRYLSTEEVQAFVVELVGALEGAEALHNPAPVTHVVHGWQRTAEAYADPDLLAVLTSDGEDFGPVPEPEA